MKDYSGRDGEGDTGWGFSRQPSGSRRAERARSRRGRIGRTWWSARWTEVLETIGLGDRLHRGRSLARGGRVYSLEISPGEVAAEVRGHREEFHDVRIHMEPVPAASWRRLEEILARQALFAARLLAGEMPQPIEEAFAEAGLSLFPSEASELEAHCDCADPAVPCPHIAAVYYLMAERFDEDPFQILHFRGRSRDDLMAALKERWSESGPAEIASSGNSDRKDENDGELAARFCDLSTRLESLTPRLTPPPIPEAVLRRLGPPPGSDEDSPAEASLRRAYTLVTDWSLRLSLKEGSVEDPRDERA